MVPDGRRSTSAAVARWRHPRSPAHVAVDGLNGIQVNLLIAKQRNGPTGDVELTFLKGITRYESKSKIQDEDVG